MSTTHPTIHELLPDNLGSPTGTGSTDAGKPPGATDLVNAPAVAWTPLHLAAHAGDMDQVSTLLASGLAVDLRAVPADGCVGATALHCAVVSRAHRVVALLLAAGASTAARDEAGYTALLLAAEVGDLPIVKLLLRAGADPRDELADLSPLGAARRSGHHQVAALLRQVSGWRPLR